MDYYYALNYIVVGDTGVGKSCLILNFLGQGFRSEHSATIGIDFGSKFINAYDKKFKLLIWDTAGQETFNSIARSYYRGANGALLVYDVSVRDSFLNIKKWLEQVKECVDVHVSFMLIGNKADLASEYLKKLRCVSYSEGEELARENNMLFVETSAKSSQNVEKAFLHTLEKINENLEKGLIKVKKVEENHKLTNGASKEKFCSC